MIELSTILERFGYLMKEKLPEYINKINKEENDGIIIKPFTNTELYQGAFKNPYYTFSFEEVLQGIKDRIIGYVKYKFVIELFLDKTSKQYIDEFCRYVDAINTMLNEDDSEYWQYHNLNTVGTKKLILTISVER